ncbi:isoquinoline 1-oxidoreductase, alpha subunit [Burkholderia sp. D7]|jgi:isoquinoline 1-oxidoreductase alpha subunit|nr:isoquinoline 1-oxidoreductase, alpha subunit [Burkholderia sp. D7]
MQLKINGKPVHTDAPEEMPLLWFLRDELGLTGTKFGCGIGMCGACTVHIDGTAARSCCAPIASLGDREVTTIEGLAGTCANAIRKAWLSVAVPQCGYCQPGQIMSASAFLAANPRPTRTEIVEAMRGNICRCGTYNQIIEAIQKASLDGKGPNP